MKKVKKLILTLIPSLFVAGLVLPVALCLKPEVDEAGEDTALYKADNSVKDYDQPDFRLNDEDDDDEDEPFVAPKTVKLHYYNENGVTGSTVGSQRAFYIWATGVDGIEVSRNEHSEFYSVSEDKKMMTLDVDYSKAPFNVYAGKASLMFIIKYEKKSASDENWGGQSEDMQLSFRTFAPNDKGLTEVWTMPAAGGGIAILDSYNKTQVHGVKQAEFTDWKTIHCKVTDNTKQVNWKLYAFDETYYKIKAKKRAEFEKWYLVKEGTGSGSAFDISLKYEAHVNVVYSIVSHDPDSDSDEDMKLLDKTVTVSYEKLYFTEKFHKYYEEPHKDVTLGMEYKKDSTTFRVWSPISANMAVLVYDDGTSTEFSDANHPGDDKANGYHMTYKSGGIWEVTIKGDLKGKYYNLQVDNTLGTNVTMDPYATSSGVCGIRGYIYDKNGADVTPDGWSTVNTNLGTLDTPQDLAIYEVHIQDFTGDNSWVSKANNKRGTYNAFVESGTRLEADSTIKTGYDHLVELGVNAVQITPTFDHDNDERPEKMKYNWGYNPLNYNIPEGGYSSDPFNGATRVKEFRNLVLQMSKTPAKTRVIMDVVYNHVSSASASCFNKLMPRYYFRYAQKDHTYTWWQDGKEYSSTVFAGTMWDGSGCNNEVATERPMMRKFIVDSLVMWAKDYNIKGFRFDLMGLIDFKTMIEAQKALYKVDKSIYLYGEGWTSGGYHGEGSDEWKDENPGAADPHNYGAFKWQVYNECNKQKVPDGVYLGSFNDTVRNQLRGENNVNGYPGKGLLQGGTVSDKSGYDLAKNVCEGLWGADVTVNTDGACTGIHLEQTVNYASCHDNWTVFDQLYNTVKDGDVNTDEEAATRAFKLVRESIQAHSLIFAGNAPAFMQGGEELLRTKELQWDPNNPTTEYQKSFTIKPSDCANMYGRWVCHNSYNTPIDVNSFKWGNKKSVTITYNGHSKTFATDDWGNEDRISHVNGITGVFADMIMLHKDSAKKRTDDANGWDDVFRKTTHNHDIGADKWIWSDTADTYGMQINETFVYMTLEASFPDAGIVDDGVPADEGTANGSWTRYIKSGYMNDPYSHSGEYATIKMREDHCITAYLTDWH